MNHMPGRQAAGCSEDGFTRGQPVRITGPPQFLTGRENIRPARPMNGTIHTATAQQACVGRIHHRNDPLLGNVTHQDGNAAVEKYVRRRGL